HPCFSPTTEQELKDFPDLIQRALYYMSLDDHPEIQLELLRIPEDKATLEEYMMTSRIKYEQLANFRATQEALGEINVSQPDAAASLSKYDKSASSKRGRGRARGRGHRYHHTHSSSQESYIRLVTMVRWNPSLVTTI
ncbi:unnamed protein product, partial [Meganyctiphanes norvegica]